MLKKEEKALSVKLLLMERLEVVYIWEKWDQLSVCEFSSCITDKFVYNVNDKKWLTIRLFLQFLNHNHNDRHISQS